jgi:hypothetical protein
MKLTLSTVCALLVAAAAGPALAGLGESGTSIQSDLARMKGSLRVNTTISGYSVHEITMASGTVVREYVSSADKVFAVSWQGPFMPDLRQVLGGYYAQYQQAASEPHLGGHRHLAIERPNLVVQARGRMRAYSGRAWAPQLLPQNFSVSDIN